MRTSKKSGIGGSWGGRETGGQAVAATLSPAVSHYQSSASGRSVQGRLLRGLGWFALVLVVIGAGIGGAAYLWFNETTEAVNGHTAAVIKTKTLLDKLGSPSDPAVALIAGYDHRASDGTNSYAGSNSDTLMLLRADPRNGTLSILSFPRDLNVPIYCRGNTISTYDRINAAWADCGANGGPFAALNTMKHLTGVPVNFLITLDFNAFVQVVHRIHGIYLNVDRRYYNRNVGTYDTNYANIDLQPGYQRINGAEALSYVRFRHLDSDIYRNGRQQLFMEALKQRLKSTVTLSNYGTVLGIVGALKGNLEIEKADGSSVSLGELRSYLGLLVGLQGGHLLRNAIPPADLVPFVTAGGADELQTSPMAVAGAVHRFLHPVVPTALHHTHRGTGTPTPKLPHKEISVLVLNAGNITGEAANTSYRLRKAGFATKTLPKGTAANAPSETRNTVVYYDSSQANGQKAAEVLAPLFGSHARITPLTPAIAHFADEADNPLTVVAIGTAYHGKLKLPHTSGPPRGSTANAHVQDGVSMTLAAVRSKQPAAHFRLMVPHKVALGSSLSTDDGVRLFKVYPNKREFVLTFNLNNGVEYWQVEESNWTDAPLFANPTKQWVDGDRTYKEFTSGGAIQTIAVFAGKSVYWVQNTILNSLSNATMIAIAEGLQPHH